MGFLSRLFGGGDTPKQENTAQIRAQYKNKKYFDKEIKREIERISREKENFAYYIEKNGPLNAGRYVIACNSRIGLLETRYSAGEEIAPLKELLIEAFSYLYQIIPEEFEYNYYFIRYSSLYILLFGVDDPATELVDFLNKWEEQQKQPTMKPIALIYLILGQEVKEVSKYKYRPFTVLTKLVKIEDKIKLEAEIKNYLDTEWYELNAKDDYGFTSHLRDFGYSGYWAWEVAAIVKRLGLDDRTFRDNPYYPKDMVHWLDKKSDVLIEK